MPTIAFDVDGTLIGLFDTPRYEVINLYRWFQGFGWRMVIWSGGGVEYAQRWNERLGLNGTVCPKGECHVDIAVDDEQVDFSKGVEKISATAYICVGKKVTL